MQTMLSEDLPLFLNYLANNYQYAIFMLVNKIYIIYK